MKWFPHHTPQTIAIKTSTDRYSAVSTGGLTNRLVDTANGEGLRSLDRSCYALLAKTAKMKIFEQAKIIRLYKSPFKQHFDANVEYRVYRCY